jgi:hypothetical protein
MLVIPIPIGISRGTGFLDSWALSHPVGVFAAGQRFSILSPRLLPLVVDGLQAAIALCASVAC